MAVTSGDPAGIGPEICVKASTDPHVLGVSRPVVFGSPRVILWSAEKFNAHMPVKIIQNPSEFSEGFINVLPVGNLDPSEYEVGQVSRKCGEAAYQYVEEAVKRALAGEVDAIATAPLNKEALNKAGYNFPGHTEILAHLTNTTDYAMMLLAGKFAVIHLTTHVSLRKACELVQQKRVLSVIHLAARAMNGLGIETPRIAVAGLNPHAGEAGLFGREEQEEIIPAIEKARSMGVNVSGPYPPDSVFLRASKGEFDIVVAMYHDQGHIPVKLLGFETGVNITVGLPVIRTSVDHGTAFDIAGKGLANPKSMIEAICLAAKMCQNR